MSLTLMHFAICVVMFAFPGHGGLALSETKAMAALNVCCTMSLLATCHFLSFFGYL